MTEPKYSLTVEAVEHEEWKWGAISTQLEQLPLGAYIRGLRQHGVRGKTEI